MLANGKTYYVLTDEIIPKDRPDAKLSSATKCLKTSRFQIKKRNEILISRFLICLNSLLRYQNKLPSRSRPTEAGDGDRDILVMVWCGYQDVSELSGVWNSENYVRTNALKEDMYGVLIAPRRMKLKIVYSCVNSFVLVP